MPHICTGLYHCNGWACNRCSAKKVYWLREQSVSFALQLANVQTTFTTLKGFKNADECAKAVKALLDLEKGENRRYNAKLDYFFTIANHDNSGWHAHILSSRPLQGSHHYSENTDNLKAAALYLVGNLKRSRSADYGSVRRYGGSSLLYKQSMKRWFQIRARLWTIKTHFLIAMIALRFLASRVSVRTHDKVRQWQVVDVSVLQNFRFLVHPVERPPPRNEKCH